MQSEAQDVRSSNFQPKPAKGVSPARAARLGIFAALGALIAFGLFGFTPRAAAGGAPDATAGEKIFKANCVLCHGEDGKGTATGKALNVADLHSEAVQKLPTPELVKVVTNGKNNMPPFKATLKPEDIQNVLSYIRQLGKKK